MITIEPINNNYSKYNTRKCLTNFKQNSNINDTVEIKNSNINNDKLLKYIQGIVVALFLMVPAVYLGLFKSSHKPGKSNSDLTTTIRNFESLKNDTTIPVFQECKSLNKNIKSFFERQYNILNANINLDDIGNPKALNRFLLSGATGSGKSYAAKIYAKSIDAEYMEVMYSDFNSRWAGQTVEQLKSVFDNISNTVKNNKNKKYVLVLNEIDTLTQPVEKITRENQGIHYITKLEERATFITYLENLAKEAPNLTIIGTTNISPKNNGIDRAVRRRFSKIIEVDFPDADCLYEALKTNLKYLKNYEYFCKNNDKQLKDFAREMASRKFSFTNLESIVNDAKQAHFEDLQKNSEAKFSTEYIKKAIRDLKISDGE